MKLVTWVLIVVLSVGPWGVNMYKFAVSDFEAPYKSEILRGIGIPFGPMGWVLGWMEIGDEGQE
jgi:hypothetical protein